MFKPSIPRHHLKSIKLSKFTKSIAKGCRSLKRFKLQGLTEEHLLQIIYRRPKGISHQILMSLLMKIINAQSSMREMITIKEIITKILWKRIFSERYCWTGRISTAR
jgi:hypothetical protein